MVLKEYYISVTMTILVDEEVYCTSAALLG
jgi:hypothetical protein